MPTQLNIFLLLFGGLQGLLFSLFLFRKKLYQSGYILLLVYLGIMLLQLTLKVMNKVWLMDNWPVLYSLSHYLPLLYGPLVYLFIKDIYKGKPFSSKTLLHFLPFFLMMVITTPAESAMLPYTSTYILYNPNIRLFMLSASLISYHLLAYRNWKKHTHSLQDDFSEAGRLQMNWLRSFILVSFIVCGLVTAALYLLYIHYPYGHEYRYGFAGLTIFMYWISYSALKQPAVFTVINRQTGTNNDHVPKLVVHRPIKKYASSTLDAKEKTRICNALETIIKTNKIYLDAELTIDRMAEKVACSRHALSQVLNECIQQSFYDYVNHYRVEEAKMLLAEESRKNHKIASIAYDAGFNSLSTFNDVFKKLSGCTPSQFRRYSEESSSRQCV